MVIVWYIGGFEQTCDFDKDLYFNPGPWRIPYHHRGILDYCKRLGVKLEPFIQVNYNARLQWFATDVIPLVTA